ncbi:MAG TPA: alternative ribosome rescue aminoacyl-tRNA hydrolase ArfB [Alphaproteobacteria bacterium]|jgi:ribosome-associated protein|nr:alternative ribosome rescue aminoacyl-tRNA hydrolase ArfB [Alphaproteobacteria bacterium]
MRITPRIAIDEAELRERFVLAAGPGGQNVNKVATAVQLRFDVARSPSLPEPVRQRLLALAGKRLTKDGVLVLMARRHRSQERNRIEARARLAELIRAAAEAPAERRPTGVPRTEKRKRLELKRARAALKRRRARPGDD